MRILFFAPFFGALFSASLAYGSDPLVLTLEKAIQIAENHNPEIQALQARAEAEDALIVSAASLDRPRIGFMREQNMNNMQLNMGPMTSWSISQEVKFPLKYFASRSAQSARADALASESEDKRLEIRQRVLSAYYSWYSAQRIRDLLVAQRETLREIARTAEARRATGAAPQQDEMKAHVEQTRLENEILIQSQEVADSEAMLRSLLNQEPDQELILTKGEFKVPRLTSLLSNSQLTQKALVNSRAVQAGQSILEEAKSTHQLAWLSLTPDFMVSYRHAFINAPPNAYTVSIEASIPIWFFSKELPEIRAARARTVEAENNLERTRRETEADVRSLETKAQSYSKLLQIYETSLLPQSVAMLNSSRAAYSAGRTSLIELLDSERSLYANRISYYQTLTKYVESLTRLERTLGTSISDLPLSGEKL